MTNYPYAGLRPFKREEADIFFGRKEHADELLNYLKRQHFLAVIGLSGCGKSSLVKTGLIPSLQAGFLNKAGTHWQIAEMCPGNHPFKNLAEALVKLELGEESYEKMKNEGKDLLQKSISEKNEFLKSGAFGLHEMLAINPLPNKSKLLIVCDQFEEIFRYASQSSNSEAAAFIALLLASEKPYPLPTGELFNDIYVVITMRSDYLGNCAVFTGLAEAINAGSYLTPRLNRAQLRLAIEKPALAFGGKVAPELVVKLLEDAENNQDQLPLLQHVLMRLWVLGREKNKEPIYLTLQDYEHKRIKGLEKDAKGLEEALSFHADEILLKDLTLEQQRLAEILFRSLSERQSEKRDTRRPVKLNEVIELAQETSKQTAENVKQELIAVIKVFQQEGCNFLVADKELTEESVIDISHESLIRQWKTMQKWITDESESAKTYLRLKDRAIEWKENKENENDLLKSPKLEIFQQWWQEKQPTALWSERYGGNFDLTKQFLNASKIAYNQEQENKNKHRRLVITGLISFSVVVSGLAGFSFLQKQKAEVATELAIEKTKQVEIEKKDAELRGISTLQSISRSIYDLGNAAISPAVGKIILTHIDLLNQNTAPDVINEKITNFNRLADIYSKLGDMQAALDYYQKTLEIRQTLADKETQYVQKQQDFSDSFDNPACFDEGNCISIEVQRDLAISFNNIANIYWQLGNLKKALPYYQQALNIHQNLAAQYPQHLQNLQYPSYRQAQQNLVIGLNNLTNVFLWLGDTQKALEFYQQALQVRRTLAKQSLASYNEKCIDRINCVGLVQDLAVSFNDLANIYLQLGDMKKALEFYQKALKVRYALHPQDTKNIHFQRDLSITFNSLTNLHLQLNDPQKALTLYQSTLKIHQSLVEQYGENAQAQRDLSISMEKLADMHLQLGDMKKALELYLQALKISKTLAIRAMRDVQVQRDFGISLEKIANFYWQLGDSQKTIDFYQQALKITQYLVAKYPNNLEVKRDLFLIYCKLIPVYKDHEKVKYLQKALGISATLYVKNLTQEAQNDWDNIIYMATDFSKQKKQADNFDELRQYYLYLPLRAYRQQTKTYPKYKGVWNTLGMFLYKQGLYNEKRSSDQMYDCVGNQENDFMDCYTEAANVFDKALKLFPNDLDLLFHDLELALVQNDMARFQQRLKDISPLLKPREIDIVIPFLSYLAGSGEDYQAVIDAIEKNKDVKVYWDWSEIAPVIKRQEQENQKITYFFIGYFDKRMDLKTLKNKLANLDKEKIQDTGYYSPEKYNELGSYQQNLRNSQEIAGENPNDAQAQLDLSTSLDNLGSVYLERNQLKKALSYYQRGLEVRQQIAKHPSNNVQVQQGLSNSFSELGKIYLRLNEPDKALSYYQEDLKIRQKLAQQKPNNAQEEWALSEFENPYFEMDNLQKTLEFYEKILKIRQTLVSQDAKNMLAQRDLLIAFNKLGNAYLERKQIQKSLPYYQEDLKIRQKFAQQKPDDIKIQRDLSVGFNHVGNLYVQLNQPDKAFSYYQQDLETRQKLAEKLLSDNKALPPVQEDLKNRPQIAEAFLDNEQNPLRLPELSNSYLGTEEKLNFYKQFLTIQQTLVAQNSQSLIAQRDLFDSYKRLSSVYQELGLNKQALSTLKQGLSIAEKLADNKALKEIQDDIKGVQDLVSNN